MEKAGGRGRRAGGLCVLRALTPFLWLQGCHHPGLELTEPPWEFVQPFSILCVFLLISLPRVGLGLSVPSNRSWSPTLARPRTHHLSKKRALPS